MKQRTPKMKVHPAAINALVDATWNFAYSMLWSEKRFSKSEIALTKFYIREYYDSIPAKHFQKQAFIRKTQFCQLILSVNEKLEYFPGHPCIFFNRLSSDSFFKLLSIN